MTLHHAAPSPRERAWIALKRRPLAWCALAAAAGILAAPLLGTAAGAVVALTGLGVAIAGRRRRIVAAAGLLLVSAGAFAAYADLRAHPPPGDIAHLAESRVTLRGVIDERPLLRRETVRLILRVIERREGAGWRPASGRVVTWDRPPAGVRPPLVWGDVVEVEGTLRRPLPPRTPGGFDAQTFWARRGVFAMLHQEQHDAKRINKARGVGLRRWAAELRDALAKKNRASLSPKAAHLANSVLFGDPEPPDGAAAAEIDALFYRTGTIHLLVVSGAQVALLLLPVLAIGLRLGPRRWPALALVIFFAIAYALVAGLEPSISRAAVMAVLYAGALAARRPPDPENLLGGAALALLAANPLWLGDAGFLLSFAAVWALLRLSEPLLWLIRAPLQRLPWLLPPPDASQPGWLRTTVPWLATALACSAAVYLCVGPILARVLMREAPVTLVANLSLGVIGAALLWAAAGSLILAIVGWLHNPLTEAVESLAALMLAQAQGFDRIGGTTAVFPAPLWAMTLAGAAIGAILWARPREHRAIAWLAVAIAAAAPAIGVRLAAPPPAYPTVTFLAVGQGDATLVRWPDGTRLLVDGGPPPTAEHPGALPDALTSLKAMRIPRLDAIALTHPDIDHAGGLPAVLAAMPVGALLVGRPLPDGGLKSTCERRGVPMRSLAAGSPWEVNGHALTILGPPTTPLAGAGSDDNNNSLVLLLQLGSARVLLPGDAEQALEAAILARRESITADVLLLGHHGSRTSSSAEWLRAVSPRVAVASAGVSNRYGHPNAEVLNRVSASGARVYRTDRDGTIHIEARPDELRIEAMR